MSDMTDKMAGKAKETTGRATGNRKLEAKGKMQHGMADMKQKTKHTINNLSDKL